MLGFAIKAATSAARRVSAGLQWTASRFNREVGVSLAYRLRKRQLLAEYQHQSNRRFNERPIEYAFVLRHLATFYPTRVLDVGCGETALAALMRTCGFHVTASDNVTDYWSTGLENWHFHVVDDDICASRISGAFDCVVCISTLEHIKKSEDAIANIIRLLNIGGYLILTCPYTENMHIPNVYELEESCVDPSLYPFVTQSFCRQDVDAWCRTGLKVVEQEYWQYYTGDAWTVGDEIIPPRKVTCDHSHQISCILFRRDY